MRNKTRLTKLEDALQILGVDIAKLNRDSTNAKMIEYSATKSILAEINALEERIAELELKAGEEHRMVESRFRYLNQDTPANRISDEERLLTDILKCIEVEMEDVQEGSSDARIYEGLDIAWAIVQYHLDNLVPF